MGQETQIKVLGMRYWGELRDTGDGLLFLCPPVPRLPNALTRETTSPLPPLPSGQWEAPPGARGSQGRPHVSDPPVHPTSLCVWASPPCLFSGIVSPQALPLSPWALIHILPQRSNGTTAVVQPPSHVQLSVTHGRQHARLHYLPVLLEAQLYVLLIYSMQQA